MATFSHSSPRGSITRSSQRRWATRSRCSPGVRSSMTSSTRWTQRRLALSTIKARPGKFTGPFHWKNRHFTVPELKRLQSFPDDYEIVGTFDRVVEQIGNSVPPESVVPLPCPSRSSSSGARPRSP